MDFAMDTFRAALRELRKRTVGGRNALAHKIGIAPSTIQNAETGPDMPGIETVAKIVYGCGETLTTFFARIEQGGGTTIVAIPDVPIVPIRRRDDHAPLSEREQEDADRIAANVYHRFTQALIRDGQREREQENQRHPDAAPRETPRPLALAAERPHRRRKSGRLLPRKKTPHRRAKRPV